MNTPDTPIDLDSLSGIRLRRVYAGMPHCRRAAVLVGAVCGIVAAVSALVVWACWPLRHEAPALLAVLMVVAGVGATVCAILLILAVISWALPPVAIPISWAALRGRVPSVDAKAARHIARYWRRIALRTWPQVSTRDGALELPGLACIRPDSPLRLVVRTPHVQPSGGWAVYWDAAMADAPQVMGVSAVSVDDRPDLAAQGMASITVVPVDATDQTRDVAVA